MLRKMTILAAAAAFAAFSGAAMAFPERAVNYIIPFNPGGESDISARLQQPYFSAITGQDAVIQYQAGAGGAQAWSVLNDQPGDGHTIMGTNLPHIVLQPLLQDPGYETDDLVNVYMFHFTPDALIVRADSEFETIQDVVDAATAAPGALTAGGSATNSANHIANQLFANGFSGHGLQQSPAVGRGLAEWILYGGWRSLDLSRFAYDRIAAGRPVREVAVV
jgi:tripartite-type tricarboxylate transporter receptor subunit TctC